MAAFLNQHNTRILALVPRDRLLIVHTQDIGRDILRLAEFLSAAGHAGPWPVTRAPAEAKFGLVPEIDGLPA
jgi:hypothetical protein